ncbi:MAG: hypothetical protein HYW48_04355 [Deltaproteobacteria bacterium]|nr:hypothetical protein [Deltaproteobacteria bacterium]
MEETAQLLPPGYPLDSTSINHHTLNTLIFLKKFRSEPWWVLIKTEPSCRNFI